MRRVDDTLHLDTAGELRALAHPLRVRIMARLSELADTDTDTDTVVTSTRLAQELGESTGATSYHLRQLARFGLIQEVPEFGNARNRGWRATARYLSVSPDAATTPEHRAAQALLHQHIAEFDNGILSAFLRGIDGYPSEWQGAWRFTNFMVHVRPEEVAELNRRVQHVIEQFERPDPADRPQGVGRAYVSLRIVPAHEP